MRVVYSAQDEPAPTGEEYWRDVIDRTIGPMDVRFPAGVDERERIVTGQVGALSIAAWETGPGEVFHTRAMLGGRIRGVPYVRPRAWPRRPLIMWS